MKIILALCSVLLFAGCDAGARKDGSVSPEVPASYLYKDAVYFPDGQGLQFSGKLRRYELVENEKGQFDRYTFEFSEDIMPIEAAVFATLAKRGYQRKVRREDDGLFVVDYVMKNGVSVLMSFERVPAKNKDASAFTRLKVSWKSA